MRHKPAATGLRRDVARYAIGANAQAGELLGCHWLLLILNWFEANKQITQAVVEDMSGNAGPQRSQRFRLDATFRIAL